ncbi:MAG: transglutaminase family protein [Dysgonamonadaceae bacterium]|jgi:transglutaminase-like putative cysteine protease|nr:transglutaminase family protein [Dysgonamonadaceae bacterium]
MDKLVEYHYLTKVVFSEKVHSHSFLLRCTPSENEYQKIESVSSRIAPAGEVFRASDCFGNTVYYGMAGEPHDSFEFGSSGTVRLSGLYALKEPLAGIFLYPSAFTAPDSGIAALLSSVRFSASETVSEKVLKLCSALFSRMEYAPNSTTIETTAAEALRAGRGVCQDYSHALISLCRLSGIAARYVAGFIEGEGCTHAWVEYYDKDCWRAADPTHNRLIETGYIKLSHGRDFDDCSIERGVFSGAAKQRLEISLQVQEKSAGVSLQKS